MCGEYDQWLHECFSKSGVTGSSNFAGESKGLCKSWRHTVCSQLDCWNTDTGSGGRTSKRWRIGIYYCYRFRDVFICIYSIASVCQDTRYYKERAKSIFWRNRREYKGWSILFKNQSGNPGAVMYSVLEFTGAISFDSMYSPLILARTGNNEMAVGIISAFMAAGCLAASIMLTVMNLATGIPAAGKSTMAEVTEGRYL